eukprot:TRINITY_DN16533_c0_g2_i1.p1 TRINITY_DN16533_c0_g2~~TRINITY_DN16533_c0_g2_i1.p1  ORF type:complete len:563 (+),score=104.90 TRINITY_DN16533_c0_g2_i1:73-1761(+)
MCIRDRIILSHTANCFNRYKMIWAIRRAVAFTKLMPSANLLSFHTKPATELSTRIAESADLKSKDLEQTVTLLESLPRIPQQAFEDSILRNLDQLTIPLYLKIITAIKPKSQILIPLLEITGKKVLKEVNNEQLGMIISGYTENIKATPEFYTSLAEEVVKRNAKGGVIKLMVKVGKKLAELGMTNHLLFKKIEAAVHKPGKLTATELWELYRIFSVVRPKDFGLREKLIFRLIPDINKLHTREIVEMLREIRKSHIHIWRSYVDADLWATIEPVLTSSINSSTIDEAIDTLHCSQQTNFFSEPFIKKLLERVKKEGFKQPFDRVLRSFVLLVEFRLTELEEYLKVIEENYESATNEQKLSVQSRLAFLSPELAKDKDRLKNIVLNNVSGKAIRDYIYLFMSEKELPLKSLPPNKQSEILESDPSITIDPQFRLHTSRVVSSLFNSKGLSRRFSIDTQVSDSHLNLIDIGIARKKPYLSFKKPNNYAVIIETSNHVVRNTGKGYASWEMKQQVLKAVGWEIIKLKQELIEAKYLEAKLAPIYLCPPESVSYTHLTLPTICSV